MRIPFLFCVLLLAISACEMSDPQSPDPVTSPGADIPALDPTDKDDPTADAVDPFCTQRCGCDANGNNCNVGQRDTDSWCMCCARNCGNNLAACNQQGYRGDNGFPSGTSRACGCVRPTGNGHDFTLANNANLGTCYSNLRGTLGTGWQTIWHPGSSNCASSQHMHIASSSQTGVFRFGIDCLGATTLNGQNCSSQVVNGLTCRFLWTGP